jgi:hypothetical protein
MIGVSAGDEFRYAVEGSGNRNGDQRADDAQGDAANGENDDDRQWMQVLCLAHDEWLQDVTIG